MQHQMVHNEKSTRINHALTVNLRKMNLDFLTIMQKKHF
jgi:hypothetical protein